MKYLHLILAGLLVISCNTGDLDEKKYQKKREELERDEREHPVNFLTVFSQDKKNFIGQTVVTGVVRNRASVSAYKHVRLKMLFYKDGTLVENHEEVVDDPVPPGGETSFKSKYFTPK